MNKRPGIYRISSILNGKFYVGSAVNLYQRWHHHKHYFTKGKHTNQKLQNHVNKYGLDDLIFEEILLCDKKDLIYYEQKIIDQNKPQFNICKIAGNSLGFRHSEKTKLKLSKDRINKPTKGMSGKKHSTETKELISEKAKERSLHPNFIKASRESNVGRKHSKDHRDLIALKQIKISPEQVNEIRHLLSIDTRQVDIAAKYNISQKAVSRIKNREGIYSQI